ncbi:MAG: DUF4870 domain-containing protein [Rubrobacteraceae bacterium]
MNRDGENYGMQRSCGGSYRPPPYRSPTTVATHGERTWSVLAHLSTFINVFTGFLGPVAAFIIWLAHRNHSPMVASHAMRSVIYQVVWLTVIAVGWAITTALTAIVIGVLLWPVMILLTIAPFIHASIAAYDAWKENKVYL